MIIPEELAFLLIRRSITIALFELVGESAIHFLPETEIDPNTLITQMDSSISSQEVYIDRNFLDRPSKLPLIKDLQTLLQQWLEGYKIPNPSVNAIVDRLPSYFVYALNQEWRRNAKSYQPLIEALDTPFSKSSNC